MRFFVVITATILLSFLFSLRQQVYAQTPTVAPTPFTLPDKKISIAGDVVSQFDLSRTVEGVLNVTSGIPIVGNFIQTWANQLRPTADVLDTGALDSIDTQFTPADAAFSFHPIRMNNLQDTYGGKQGIPKTIQQIQKTSRLCVRNPSTGRYDVDAVSRTIIRSKPVEYIPNNSEHGEKHNAFWNFLAPKTANDSGQYDFDNPYEDLLPETAKPCDTNDSSVTNDPQNLTTTGENIYGNGGIITDFTNLIGNFLLQAYEDTVGGVVQTLRPIRMPITAFIKITGRYPLSEVTNGNFVGAQLSYLNHSPLSESRKEEIAKRGGFIQTVMFGPLADRYRPAQAHGDEQNSYTAVGGNGGTRTIPDRLQAQNSTVYGVDFMNCNYTFHGIQNRLSSRTQGVCKQGGCELPSLPEDPSCNICNVDDRLGPLAQKILNAAAMAYNVPASNIYAAMLHEGADWHLGVAGAGGAYTFDFTNDELVKKWSVRVDCPNYEPMPQCDNEAPQTQAPFGFIRAWFYAGDNRDSPWKAVQIIDPERNSKEKVSRCNFMDAAFAAASSLHQGSSMTNSGTSCGPYGPFTNVRPASCSSWNSLKIAQSQVGYMGQCPETSPYEDLPFTIADVVGWNNAYSCH